MSFQFDDFVLDEERRTLRRAGRPVALTPKALDTLLALVRRSGRLVAKDELLQAVWPDTFIEEATLAQNVFTVRKALGARAGGGAYIETVPRHGYRFAAEVRPLEAVPEPFAAEPSAAQVPADRLPRLSMRLSMRRWPAVSAALLVPIAAAVVLAAGARRRPEPAPGHVTPHPMPLLIERVERLTADGGARHAAVSGSGAYVAFVREETDGRQGLWLRQTHSGTLSQASAAVPVVPAAAVRFGGVAFAPGDRSLLYVAYPDGEAIAGLFEVPVLGGMPRRLLLDADSPPAVSAGGTRLAFVRNEPAARASALMVADRDGSHARVVARRRGRESF
ncbi:MAG TPA: transcriptional regulator, partial [Thermoanaerobaculia bacterium]|nr:transcriptional regulator [Thermoanaerobaculia bacterium]